MGKGNTPAVVELRRAEVDFATHEYELVQELCTYGESVAAALGIAAARLFKTLIAQVDGNAVAALVPVDGQLSLKTLAAAAGGKRAKLAASEDAQRWTGYVTGGISPFGQKCRLPAFVDESAFAHETVFVSGGRRGLQIELPPQDLAKAIAATVVPGLGTNSG